MSKGKIGYFCSFKYNPGLYKEFTLLGREMEKRGWRINYLLSWGYNKLAGASPANHFFLTKSESMKSLMADSLNYLLGGWRSIRTLFSSAPPDFICFYNPHPLNLIVIRQAQHLYPRSIRTIYLHEPYVPDRSSYGTTRGIMIALLEWMQSQMLGHTSDIILPSSHAHELFMSRYPNYPGMVHIAPILLSNRLGTKSHDRRYLSLVGNLNKSRGPEDFLTLVHSATVLGENLKFKIITRSNIQRAVDKLPHQDRKMLTVVNKPLIADEEITDTVAESIALFLPHRQAAQSGNVPVAFRAGTPVIARDIPGLSQHVRHRENGYLFPLKPTPEQLIEAVRFVRDNFAELSRCARRDFEDIFAEQNFDRYYQWLLKRKM